RDIDKGEGDVDSMLVLLKSFWDSVRQTFPEAWGVTPRKSRLMHGAGIVAMGFVMDAIAEPHVPEALPSKSHFMQELALLAPACRWTRGAWEFGVDRERQWNEIQNTPGDILLLTNHLLRAHRRAL